MCNLTPEEAQEIYYALESKIAPTGIASDDKKWKADIEAIMDKIGVDGCNLAKSDFEINMYPVAYIEIDDPGLLDQIASMLDTLVSGNAQFLIPREMLDDSIKAMEEGQEIEEDEKEAFELLVKIVAELKDFGGDVWFYAR
jgi:hypothetical protein